LDLAENKSKNLLSLKRTCLQKNTNTHEQTTCEFHPDEISLKVRPFDPKDIQYVKSFGQMKRAIIIIAMVLGCFVMKASETDTTFFDNRDLRFVETLLDSIDNLRYKRINIDPYIEFTRDTLSWINVKEYAGDFRVRIGTWPPERIYNNKEFCKQLVLMADSLSKVPKYSAIKISQLLCDVIIKAFEVKRGSIVQNRPGAGYSYTGKENCLDSWELNMVRQTMKIYLDNLSKYDRSFSNSYFYKASCVWDEKLIVSLKNFFKELHFQEKEFKLMSNEYFVTLDIRDTLGLNSILSKDRRSRSSLESWKADKYPSLISKSDKEGIPLKELIDSINQNNYRERRDRHVGKLLDLENLFMYIKTYNLTPIAPTIESIYKQGIYDRDMMLELLISLNYKDYKSYYIDSIGNVIDSLVTLFIAAKDPEEISKLQVQTNRAAWKLKYFSTQESYYRLAPLLLVDKIVEKKTYSGEHMAWRPYCSFAFADFEFYYIVNFPFDWEKLKAYKKDLYNSDKVVFSGENIEETKQMAINSKKVYGFELEGAFGVDYFKTLYQWMMKNKGNYKIDRNI
jgi:hypothetical protein